MLLCMPYFSHPMRTIVLSTETECKDVSPTQLNRLRPSKILELDPFIESLFVEEFTIDPEEIFLYSMFQENVLTLRSIHIQAGKKITRKIYLKRLAPKKT